MPSSENTITVDSAPPRVRVVPGSKALRSCALQYRHLFGEAAWICVGQVLAVVGMLAGLRWLTALLSPAEYGRLALGMTLATLAQTVLLSPLTAASQRFFAPASEAGELPSFVTAIKGQFCWTLAAVAGLCTLLVGTFLTLGLSDWAVLAAASFLFAAIAGGNSILDAVQTAARERLVVAMHQAASQWLRFLAAAMLLVLFSKTASAAMFGYALASLVILVSQWLCFRRRLTHLELERRTCDAVTAGHWRTQMLAYMWPFMTWGVFCWMHLASDRWALEISGGSADVGYYAVLYQVGFFPLSFASGVIVQLVYPLVFSRAGNAGNPDRVRVARGMVVRITTILLAGTLLAFVIVKGTHAVIFDLFIDSRYHSVSHLMPWVVLAGGLFATSQSLALNQLADMNARQLIAPKIGTALTGIGLNFLGVWLWGIVGLIAANCVTTGFYCVWMFALAWNRDVRHT